MSNNAIPPSRNNPLGSIENDARKKDPYYSIESDEKQKQEGQEKSSQLESSPTDAPTDLLQKRIEQFKENAPKSKEKFYQHSFEIFSKLNKCVKGNDSNAFKDSKKSHVSHIVSEYVDLVHEYPDALKLIPIWDLAYLLYFSSNSNLATDLNDWINEHDPILEHTEDPEYDETEQDDYLWIWESSRRHLLRGNFTEAISTLQSGQHMLEEGEIVAVNNIIALIKNFDALQGHKYNQITYAEKWTAWHEECANGLDLFMRVRDEADDFREVDEEIRMIYCILFGNEASIFYSGSYFERVIGTILYSRPAITMADLAHLAQRAIQDDPEVDMCAYVLMGCFDDAFEACHDLWLQTHLGHALIIVGAKSISPVDTSNKSDEYIVDPIYYCIEEYANTIAEKKNMWKEAVVYVSACVENREIWIKKLLGDPPLESKDISLLKSILDIATHAKMTSVQQFIHRAIGHRYEQKKDIHQATIEYGKAKDLKSLDRFAHEEFSQYLKTGKLGKVVTDMDELKASPHYAMLILYQQFRAHLGKKEWKEASKLVLELLKSNRLPTKFETVLLIDNLVILEDKKQYYDQKELLRLIEIFKQITKESPNEQFISKYYQFVYHKELPAEVVSAKLRERIAYKAATASAV